MFLMSCLRLQAEAVKTRMALAETPWDKANRNLLFSNLAKEARTHTCFSYFNQCELVLISGKESTSNSHRVHGDRTKYTETIHHLQIRTEATEYTEKIIIVN